MDKVNCFNLDELNDSLVVTTNSESSPVQKIQTDIKFHSQRTDEYQINDANYLNFEKFIQNAFEEVNLLKLQHKSMDKVFNLCSGLIKEYSQLLKQILIDTNQCQESFETIQKLSEFAIQKLSGMNAAYKRKKEFNENPFYVQPIGKNLGIRWCHKPSATENIPNYVLKSNTYHMVPIIPKIKSLFARPAFSDMFFNFNNTKHTCEEGVFFDYCCAQNAKECELLINNQNSPSIMIEIGADAFDICSPIKSKAVIHKLMGIYFRIRNLPPEYASRLNNFHLIALCDTEHLKERGHSFGDLIEPLMEEIKELETKGIDIGGENNIKGTLINFCGDNLGCNEAFGFTKGFNGDYFCRMCFCTKAESEKQTYEVSENMRDEQSYMDLVKIAETEDTKSSKGVVEYCKFNDSENFHILKNYTVDVMHDFNEGILHVLLKKIFDFILDKKILGSKELISIIRDFNYGCLNTNNKPSTLNLTKRNYNQNATQIYTLIIHLPLILYKWRIQLTPVWYFLKKMLNIMQIIYSPKIEEINVGRLQVLIQEYLTALVNEGTRLTPKHHNLIHYPTVIRKMGPVIHMWAMRMESKHKHFTDHARTLHCFKNVSYSLSIRHEELASLESYEYKNEIKESIQKKTLGKCSNFNLFNRLNLIDWISEGANAPVLKFLEINSYKYRKGFMLIRKNFALEIVEIVKSETFLLICSKYEMISFDSEINCIEIKKRENEFMIIDIAIEQNKKTYTKYQLNNRLLLIADTLEISRCFETRVD